MYADVITTQDLYLQLEEWVLQGKSGLEKIQSFLMQEVDEELTLYAKALYKEAILSYITPENEDQQYEFTLSKLIHQREKEILSLEDEKLKRTQDLHDLTVQHDVDKKLYGNECALYLVSEDVLVHERHQIFLIEKKIKEYKEWIVGAKGFIEHETYMNLPDDVFDICTTDVFTNREK